MIADAARPVAIAGVMGGEDSEVTDETTDVPSRPRTSSRAGSRGRRNGSDCARRPGAGGRRASTRTSPEDAARLCSQLFAELAGAGWTGESDVSAELPEPAVIHLRPEHTSELLGLEVEPDEQRGILEALGFEVSDWNVTVPTWRARDVTREVDLVEEVGRMKLDEVPFTLPARREMYGRLSPAAAPARRRGRARRARLLRGLHAEPRGRGPDPDAYRIPQPQSQDMAVLRTTLLPSLIQVARHNLDVGNDGIAVFEIAHVYRPSDEELPDERVHVAGLAQPLCACEGRSRGDSRRRPGHRGVRAGRAPLLHPGQTATTTGGILGGLRPGQLEGEWSAFELDLGALDPGRAGRTRTSSPIHRSQDLAFAVPDEVLATDLVAAARGGAGAGRWSRSTSTVASRSARGASRSRSASSSARPSARSRTRRPRDCARRSSPRSASVSAPSFEELRACRR